MITRLWDHAKTRSSIVAIVGEDHIYGMRHYWRLMVMLKSDGNLSKLVYTITLPPRKSLQL